jgi:hypothetical protein
MTAAMARPTSFGGYLIELRRGSSHRSFEPAERLDGA